MADELLNVTLKPTLLVSLVALVSSKRTIALAQYDSYARSTQYENRRYDWDGKMMGYGEQADISPGWYVPLRHRKPRVTVNLPVLITERLTAFALGSDHWPSLKVTGDPAAEDYVQALAEESDLALKISEARSKGGASGTAVVSAKFFDGKPRVVVHEARHIHVLEWVDRDDFKIKSCLKVYSYQETVWDRVTGKPKEITLYVVRYWDEQVETVWDPIPESIAKTQNWSAVKSNTVAHNFGECPVYWAQNRPDSEHEDGISDFDGLLDKFDEANVLLSSTSKGTIANVDPTLVIKDNPSNNGGVVRKGSGTAIYSPGGADFLTLEAGAMDAALSVFDRTTQICLDVSGVVLADPKDIAAKAASGAALKLLYQPMVSKCDVLRSSYGKLIVRVLLGLLRAAKRIGASPAGAPVIVDGKEVRPKSTVVLPPRFDKVEGGEPNQVAQVERLPGTGENLTLAWPAYFPATAEDIAADVTSAKNARNVTISPRTAVAFTARHFNVTDVDAELAEIDASKEVEMQQLQQYSAPPPEPGATSKGSGSEE